MVQARRLISLPAAAAVAAALKLWQEPLLVMEEQVDCMVVAAVAAVQVLMQPATLEQAALAVMDLFVS
jgi:hypothetical protein